MTQFVKGEWDYLNYIALAILVIAVIIIWVVKGMPVLSIYVPGVGQLP
jgi:hypothetical protein